MNLPGVLDMHSCHLRFCHAGSLALLLLLTAGGRQILAQGKNGFAWQVVSPESQGMSAAKLEALRGRMEQKKTDALVVIRNDKIVLEWYAAENARTKPHSTASLAKALVGGLAAAVAINDGQLSLDDPAYKFIPQWQNDERKRQIRIRHLGSHTSGIEDAEA